MSPKAIVVGAGIAGLTAGFRLQQAGYSVRVLEAGRLVGGPKLWPAISPNKTWSGGVAGAVAGTAAGVAVAAVGGIGPIAPIVTLSLLLSVVSQFGDLFESALKRRFGVKDASHAIPGHGGMMDRLDGFLAAAVAAALVGLARGGIDGAAAGFLLW